MPYYKFRNNDTEEEYTILMGITEADVYLEKNPHIEKLFNGGPLLHSGVGLGGGLKVDNGFNDLLKTIKKGNSKGFSKSTIETK